MKTSLILVGCFLILYLVILGPFTCYMRTRPIVEKLGYVPSVKAVKVVSVDQKELTAAMLVLKVLMYFGGLIEEAENEIEVAPDFPAISRLIHNAVQLDPYNMDAYYFGQATLIWEVGQVEVANELLDYGMRYRTWDWQLPFFAGFNHAFFLKDYQAAASYYQKAGELSGSDLFKRLAGRYMLKSGRTDMAIGYLSSLIKSERNPAIKKTYQIRLAAFREVRRIEVARDKYKARTGHLPDSVQRLVQAGVLSSMPIDPYGGKFFLEPDGTVSTTSKFAFSSSNKTD